MVFHRFHRQVFIDLCVKVVFEAALQLRLGAAKELAYKLDRLIPIHIDDDGLHAHDILGFNID